MRVRPLLMFVALVAGGCGAGTGSLGDREVSATTAPTTRAPNGEPAPLTLIVSNQSFDHPTVEITIEVDGVEVVGEAFDVEGQHSWEPFGLDLPAGGHHLHAVSDTGAEIDGEFVTADNEPLWAVLSYWSDAEEPRHFTLSTMDDPPGFG